MRSIERMINMVSFLILASLTLAAGAAVYLVMLKNSETILSESLQLSLQSSSALLRSSIAEGLNDARMISTRPFIIDSFARLAANRQNRTAITDLDRIAQSFVSSRTFTAVSYDDLNGVTLASAGNQVKNRQQRLVLDTARQIWLFWDGQFILHVRTAIVDNHGTTIGNIVTESRLPPLTESIAEMNRAADTAEVAMCTSLGPDEMACLLGRDKRVQFQRLPRIMANKPLPANYALTDKTGVVFSRDYRGIKVVAAYMPIPDYGLGMVLKMDQSELFVPATRKLGMVGILLTALVVLGALMLHWMMAPIVRKLVDSGKALVASNRELHKLNEKHAALLRNASDGIHILDQTGQLVECSDSFCNMLGYERDQLIGKHVSFWDAVSTEERIMATLNLRLSTKGRSQFETRHRCQDGRVIDVEVSVYPLHLENQPVLFCSSRNVSERKIREEALRQNRNQLEELLENMSSGVAVYQAIDDGADFAFIRINRAAEDMSQIRRDELAGKTLKDVFPGVVDMGLLDAFRRVWQSGHPEHFPVSFYQDERISGWRDNYIYKLDSGELVAIFDDVTERMQLQEALRHERDFMDAIFQSAGTPILAIDQNGVIVRFNRAAEEFSGYSYAEVSNKPFFWKNFLLPDQQDEIENVFHAVFAGDTRARYENTWVSRTGESRVLDWANTLIRDDSGNPAYLLAVGIDITQRKAAESLIRIQSNALEASTNGIAIADAADPELPLIYVNPAFVELTGYSRSELIGKNCRFLQGDDTHQPGLDEIRAALKHGKNGNATLRNYRKDGTLFWNRLYLSPILDENGKLTHFLGISNDVTERRNADEYLRLVSSVFHHADEGIVIADEQAMILEVNPAFTRITGYEREEVLGKNPNILNARRHDQTFYTNMWRKLVRDGHWSGEMWNKRKNGEVYPERLTLSAIRNQEGKIIRYIALFSDISDLKRQQLELERLAHHDALTGLPNRSWLNDKLDFAIAQAEQHKEHLAVCFMDLDGFKRINDSFGHEAGDQLLVEVAQRLLAASRATDIVSRLGGDEFVLVFTNMAREECHRLANRIMASIEQPFDILSHEIRISTSIGVAIFPEAGVTSGDLLRVADQAMYLAKQSGRGRVRFFDAADSAEG